MPTPTGHWLCKLDGYPELDTDQLTLREVVVAEKVCGLPYSMLDPRISAKVAMALFVLMMVRNGSTEDDAVAAAEDLPVQALHDAFTWREHDTQPPTGTGAASPPPSAATSPAG